METSNENYIRVNQFFRYLSEQHKSLGDKMVEESRNPSLGVVEVQEFNGYSDTFYRLYDHFLSLFPGINKGEGGVRVCSNPEVLENLLKLDLEFLEIKEYRDRYYQSQKENAEKSTGLARALVGGIVDCMHRGSNDAYSTIVKELHTQFPELKSK